MPSRIYVTVGCPSVSLSVDRQQQRRASGLLLSAGACSRYRSTATASTQCTRSAANAGSVMLRAEGRGGSTLTCLQRSYRHNLISAHRAALALRLSAPPLSAHSLHAYRPVSGTNFSQTRASFRQRYLNHSFSRSSISHMPVRHYHTSLFRFFTKQRPNDRTHVPQIIFTIVSSSL